MSEIDQLQNNREKVIVRTSIIGILANLLLAGFKAAVGAITHSIAIILDAVNNLSDALSSVITIVGTFLAGKKPDKKHPLGYGRIEYLSAMIITAIVLYAGVTSLVESVKKIIHPELAQYNAASIIILASAIIVKLVLGQFVKKQGQKVNSQSLVASGSDALFDAILSASVLVSAVIFLLTKVSLEAYVGVIISAFIIKSGFEMLTETLDEILGHRVEAPILSAIRETICEEPEVDGAYDLILHSYGPDRYVGSVHVEVADTMTADELDHLQRRIAQNVFQKHGIVLTGIGIYATNTKDEKVIDMRTKVYKQVRKHEGVLQIHGFHMDEDEKRILFDVILDFALEDREKTFREIQEDLSKTFPDYTFILTMDLDFL